MQAIRTTLRQSRGNLYVVQKRFGGSGSYVPADMPVVKQKWRSVETIETITRTMRNIAAGKLPSAREFLTSTRPFAAVVGPMFETTSPPDNIKNHLHVVVGCERGLCGVVGSNLPKKIVQVVNDAPEGIKNEVVVLGSKTASNVQARLKDETTCAYVQHQMKMPTMGACLAMTDSIFQEREFEQCTLYYNVFKNTQSYILTAIDTYNLDISTQIAELQFPSYDVEGDERTIIQNLQEFKFATTLYNCMAEQLASEMASRLNSMDSASKNCAEKAKEYESIYQRLRKAKITNELTVLSVGAKLAKKK